MISRLFFLNIFFAISGLLAQTPDIIIKGQVVDASTRAGLSFANLALLQTSDSVVVGGGYTEDNGAFELSASAGTYLLRVAYLGYEQAYFPIQLSEGQESNELGQLSLEAEVTSLEEVEITAERNLVQMGLDKKIYNISQGLARTGGSAAEVLDNIPSISVDIEGNVSLRGSNGVRILVDGKPSGLLGIDIGMGLQQLPANMIDRIEVVTNPSVRYEAEGTAGVINIILKKEKKKGWNGAFELGLGYPHNHNGSLNLNFRRKKFNLFANAGLRYRKTPGRGYSNRETFRGDTTEVLNQDRRWERGGWSYQLRLGADWYLSPQNTLTGAVTIRRGRELNTGELKTLNYQKGFGDPQGSLRITEEIEQEHNLDYSLNYARTFEREGQKLTADVMYSSNGESEAMDALEQAATVEWIPVGDSLLQRINNSEYERRLILQSDYIHPFGSDGKFEAGYRGSIREIGNDYKVEEFDPQTGEWELLTTLSNEFIYDENIQAGYAILGNKHKRFSYQAGLRLEYTLVETHLIETDEKNRKEYTNLFPSLHLGYEMGLGNTIQVSYSRRVRRPRFRDLNPFFSYSNPYSIRSGNPDLNPEFTHSLEIGNVKYWNKANLGLSIYYRHTDGVIQWIQTVDENGISYTQPENLSSRDDLGGEVTFSVDPLKWWKLSGGVNAYKGWVNGDNLDESFGTQYFSWSAKLNSKMSIGKDMDIQLVANYQGPEQTVQGKRLDRFHMDFGLSKDIIDGKATLSFRISDVFNSRKRRGETFGEGFYQYGEWQWRQRQFFVSFSYRLNQKKKRGKGGMFQGGGGGDM